MGLCVATMEDKRTRKKKGRDGGRKLTAEEKRLLYHNLAQPLQPKQCASVRAAHEVDKQLKDLGLPDKRLQKLTKTLTTPHKWHLLGGKSSSGAVYLSAQHSPPEGFINADEKVICITAVGVKTGETVNAKATLRGNPPLSKRIKKEGLERYTESKKDAKQSEEKK
jgi:hypothetical protein